MEDDTVTELQFGEGEQYRDLNLGDIDVSEESEPLITPPDPKKSRREKPPKTSKEKEKKRATVPRYVPGKYVKPLTQMYAMAAMGISVKDPVCGKAVMESAENCAMAWDAAAKENTAIRRALQALTEGSTYAALIAAHVPVIMAVAGHHMPDNRIAQAFASEQEQEAVSNDQRAA